MSQFDAFYNIRFAGAVCLVCSIFVSGSAVLLGPKQAENKVLDRQRKVIEVAGLVGDDEALGPEDVRGRFAERVRPQLIELASGAFLDGDALGFDPKRAAKDPTRSREAPPNDAGVRRLPERTVIYLVEEAGRVQTLVLPIEGLGLWSTLYGFVALDVDGTTVKGLTYYEHGETPGLGGEVDNPRWQALWRGRRIFDDAGAPKIEVVKGRAGAPGEDPHRVDGISGATITGNGVTQMMRFWFGPDGFGPLLTRLRREGGLR